MKWLTIPFIKKHSRIDFSDEDEVLELYADSAEETILGWCQRTYEEFIDEYGEMPQPIVHASLLLVNSSYEHRSPATVQNLSVIPYGNIDVLIRPYMRL